MLSKVAVNLLQLQSLTLYVNCKEKEDDIFPVDSVVFSHTLPTDQQLNLEFHFKSVFKLEFQPEFGVQLGIPIQMGINLGECMCK